jgi:hypothetical protein
VARFCCFNVAGDDAAMRAGAFDAADVNAGLFGEAASER